MLRIALKLLVYLSILTSTRTSSSYLEPQSLGSFRPQQQQQPDDRLRPLTYETEDTYEWPAVITDEASPFIPRLINPNNMLHTKLSNTNRKKARKSKKTFAGSKMLYENHSKRKSSLSEEVPALTASAVEGHHSNKSSLSNHTTTQIDAKHERELQELFGIEGARKYQEYQLKQQLFGQQLERGEKPSGDEVKEVPVKKSGLGEAEEMQDVSGAMINQMMSRTTRRQREYDVPLIRELIFEFWEDPGGE
jgi:hypothetical protein